MKIFSGLLITLFALLIITGCNGKGSGKKDAKAQADTITVPDTGYTGIKQYMSGQLLVKEVTFKNGVREGLMKSFYQDGKLYQTFWYHNGFREDSARWYYRDGSVFRATPYKMDTVDGIQKQYYSNGKVKAKIGYIKGLRTPYIEEFDKNGRLVKGYPELVVNVKDEYQNRGVYSVSLALSNKSERVKFYRGDLSGGVFDTAHCKILNTIKGVGYLNLKKTSSPKASSVGVIAVIVTDFANKYLVYKKIELPYEDLN